METLEYSNWRNMLSRCRNPNVPEFKNYGARGITVCPRWFSFSNFWEDMGPRPSPTHSIDRIDNSGNYEPSNCRWATPSQQQRNTSDNRILEYDGKRMCIADWCDATGLTRGQIMSRLHLGWSIEKTLSTRARLKLRPAQLEEIKSRISARNGAALAREFGVSRGTISMIRTGKIWK